MINLFLSVAIFLNFVLYFIKEVIDSIIFLKKNFRNDSGNGLKNILKRGYKFVLITNIFIDSNRSFDRSYFDY
jgi:hypothetical protein